MARITQLGRLLMSKPDSCEIISKSDQWFLRTWFFALYRHEFLHVSIVQKALIHQSHIYRQIKILRTIFEKGHPRNIPVKLFQNLISSFGEDFLRISSCSYSARSPHSPEPCLWMDQNFTNNFWKGSPKEHSCEIISKSDLQFRKRRFFKNFFMSLYSARSPNSSKPCFWADQNFANKFWKGLPKEHSCKIISKSDQRFWRRRFFKNFFMFI